MKLNIIFSGVGGQGIVVLSDILCEAALLDRFDVAKAEVHGMAQRGGSIVAHVRIGDWVEAPLIERGKVDIILGFEILETARVLPMLKTKGTVVMNMKYIPPTSVLQGSSEPVDSSQLVDRVRKKATKVYEIDAISIANRLGNSRVANTVLLGAFSAIPENQISRESLETAIAGRFKQKFVNINLKALQLGRESVQLG